jgi:hypothetical protein
VDRAREERTAQEGGFTSRATALLEGMQERYLGTLRPLVEAALSTGAAPPDLAAVPVPGGAEYQEFVRDYLREVFELGRRALAEETGQAAGGEIPDRERWWLEVRAEVIAADHVAQLRSAVLTRVLTGIRAALPAEQIFSEAGVAAVEALSWAAREEWNQAAAEVLALLNGSAVLDEDLTFHQRGKHDQRAHGRHGGQGGGGVSYDFDDGCPETEGLNVDREKLARAANWYVERAEGKFLKSLTPEEQGAVKAWTHSETCDQIQAALRRGDDPGKIAHVKELDTAIAKAPLDRDVLVFRVMRGEALLDAVDRGNLAGATLPISGFQATARGGVATHFDAGETVVAQVIVRKGMHAAPIEKLSYKQKAERELLLPRDQKLKVHQAWTGPDGRRRMLAEIMEE